MPANEALRRAFRKTSDGSWICEQPVTLHSPAGRIQVTAGSRFFAGEEFMGFDIVKWLEAHLGDSSAR